MDVNSGVDAAGGAAVPSVWDRTRQLVAQEILDAALRLFTEQGYDATPVAQIAREAGVSQRTLFRYFGTKEDLLGGDPRRYTLILSETIAGLPAEDDAWAALRAGFAAAIESHEDREQALARFRLLHSTPALLAGWVQKRLRMADDVLPHIAARTARADSRGLSARAVVAVAFACFDLATAAWVENNGEDDVMGLYDVCLAAVRHA